MEEWGKESFSLFVRNMPEWGTGYLLRVFRAAGVVYFFFFLRIHEEKFIKKIKKYNNKGKGLKELDHEHQNKKRKENGSQNKCIINTTKKVIRKRRPRNDCRLRI